MRADVDTSTGVASSAVLHDVLVEMKMHARACMPSALPTARMRAVCSWRSSVGLGDARELVLRSGQVDVDARWLLAR